MKLLITLIISLLVATFSYAQEERIDTIPRYHIHLVISPEQLDSLLANRRLKYNRSLELSKYDLTTICARVRRKARLVGDVCCYCSEALLNLNSPIEPIHLREINTFFEEVVTDKYKMLRSGIRWSNTKCDRCRKHTILFNFASAEVFCGRTAGKEGIMIICPYCIRQVDFITTKIF